MLYLKQFHRTKLQLGRENPVMTIQGYRKSEVFPSEMKCYDSSKDRYDRSFHNSLAISLQQIHLLGRPAALLSKDSSNL